MQIGLVCVVALGIALRLIRLGVDSIWYDEAVSLLLAAKDLPAMIAHTAGDIHPPLYYALLHLWMAIAGASEFAAGLFSVLWGVLLIPLIYWLGRQIVDARAGLLAAFLVAVSPYNIWYSQELRMYTLGACLGLLALWGLRRGMAGGRRARWGWGVYILSAAAGMYVLYYFAFLLIVINLWAFARFLRSGPERGRRIRPWAGAQIAALTLYTPWLPAALRQVTNPPVPPWRDPTRLGRVLAEAWTALSFGQSVEFGQVWPLLILALGLVGWGFWRLWRKARADALLLAGYVAGPLVLILLVSLWTPLYHVRYVFTYSPPFYLLLAIGLLALFDRRRMIGVLAGVLLLAGAGFSLWQYHTDPLYAPDDHRAAVQYVNAHWQPGDAVLIDAGYVYPVVDYYNQLPVAWQGRLADYGTAFDRAQAPDGLALLLAGSVDAPADLGWGSPDSDFYAISREDMAQALARLFADYERVWVYRCYDTVTDPDGFIRAWLEEHGTKFEETPAFEGQSYVRVQGFLTPRSALLPETGASGHVIYGNRLVLAGASVKAEESGDLSVVLWWRPLDGDLPRLSTTTRLVDTYDGTVWAQVDERPIGLYDTTLWLAGGIVRQPLTLPAPTGLLTNTYQVQVGVYETDTSVVWPGPQGQSLMRIAELGIRGIDRVHRALPDPVCTFGKRITLLSADFDAGPVEAGRDIQMELLWQANQNIATDWTVFAQLLDDDDMMVAHQEAPPANGRSRTSTWQTDQLVRERRSLHVPADLPAGTCRLVLGLYNPEDGSRLAPDQFWLWDTRDYLTLSEVEVYTRTAQLAMPIQLDHTSGAKLTDDIALVGYSLDPANAWPGDSLGVTLVWHVAGSVNEDYSVYCHLLGPDSDLWGQAEGVPAGGTRPTGVWMAGEYILDEHTVPVQADAPAGEYRLRVGFYVLGGDRLIGLPVELGPFSVGL